MKPTFQRIGLMGRVRNQESATSLLSLRDFLLARHYDLFIEAETAAHVPQHDLTILPQTEFGKNCDLVIVVGGDGSMLNAARTVVDDQTPVLGINRGRLGFLTDIHPDEFDVRLQAVLQGEYITEKRFLLTADICHADQILQQQIALNDVVLLPGEFVRMIEFEIYINQQLMCSQRADGQIIATPTGSTAYALSGGGPILHPELDALVLVPMFSHTLSARPIVIKGDSEIEIVIAASNASPPQISCDGQERIAVAPGDRIRIHKKPQQLTLLHPKDYHYFATLRKKLHWQKKL